jgi:hypothetical protein
LTLANECPDVESIFIIGGVHLYREAFEEQFVDTVYETSSRDGSRRPPGPVRAVIAEVPRGFATQAAKKDS